MINCLVDLNFTSLQVINVSVRKVICMLLKVKNMFEMKRMGIYHGLNSKIDVLLLANVFEKFMVCASNIMDKIFVIIPTALD